MKLLIMFAQEHTVLSGLVIIVVLAWLSPILLGAVFIRERQVGVVVKKFGARSLPPGRFIALAGEAGYQADTLPPGLHFGWPELDMLSASWSYLAFGEGNIPWKVRELIQRAERDPAKRPRVIVG